MRLRVMLGVLVALVTLGIWTTESVAMYTPNPAGRWAANHFFLAGDLQYNGDKDLDSGGSLDDEVGLFVRPSYAFAENATVYGRLGFQDADHLETEFAAGVGVQAAWALPQAKAWALGGSLDVLYWNAETNGGSNIDYTEIQLTPAVSYQFPQSPMFTPYAGLMLDFITGDLDEDDPVGLLFGTNIDVNKHIRLDAQFRVISEEGLFFSAGYLF